jgi:hypothetical protein
MSKHSQYWMDTELFDDEELTGGESAEEVNIVRITRLSAVRRAVSNFVNILTSRNDITVRYSSGKESYTDGKEVIIAADDNPDHFDSMVGLALHEGSHVLLTDFTFIKELAEVQHQLQNNYYGYDSRWNGVSMLGTDSDPFMTASKLILHPALAAMLPPIVKADEYQNPTPESMHAYREVAVQFHSDLKMLMNILEDRRIDRWVYRAAGGYRPYYEALYNRYFFTSEIGKNLRWNPEWRELTVENYINRLLFCFHPDAKSDALPGLPALIAKMDLKNIDRVAPENDYQVVDTNRDIRYAWQAVSTLSYDVTPALWKEANELYLYILRFAALGHQQQKEQGNQPADPNQQGEQVLQRILENAALEATSGLPNLDPGEPMMAKPVEEPEKKKNGTPKPSTFNGKRGKSQADKAKDVLNGQLKKKKATKAELQAAAAMEEAQAKMVDLKGDGIPGGECMVTKRVTDAMVDQEWFIFGSRYTWDREATQKSIAAGKRMGAILVHRLQVRNDPVLTKNTRLQHGGLDRRLLAQLGMEITSVFQKSRVDTYKPAMLHLTLDASGSMGGRKWQKVLTIATALAYVGTKMRNVDTVITLRGGNDMPIVCVVFDSRRDRFPQWLKWAPKLAPAGATPEGLCFKATMELITECAGTHDVYFINFSDGEPTFSLDCRPTDKRGRKKGRQHYYSYGENESNVCSYGGDLAYKHTRQMVQNMRDHGIKVLSYFISDSRYESGRTMDAFRRMYGQDAVAVNVESASEVLRTLNKLLTVRV